MITKQQQRQVLEPYMELMKDILNDKRENDEWKVKQLNWVVDIMYKNIM